MSPEQFAYRVLHVEDSHDYCDLFYYYARQRRLDVTYALTGEDALELLANQHFDCILLDYMLPDYSGKEIVEKLRQDDTFHLNQHAHIIATSALEIPSTLLTELYLTGISLFLPKTFPLKEMVEIVRHFCFATRAQDKTKPHYQTV